MKVQQSLLTPPTGDLQVPLSPPPPDDGNLEAEKNYPLSLSLVIPTYNERQNIVQLVNILSQILDEALPNDYELIVVDDNSPDRTWEVAASLIPEYPQLRVLRREGEKGLSSAVVRGWQVARGDILGVIDADLQHPPEVLLKLFEQTRAGADLALASRHVEGGGVSQWSLTRRFLSRGAQLLGLVILPNVVGRVSDPMSGYFMVNRQAIAGPILNPMGYKILLEVIGRGNIDRIAEVGYVFQERQDGESKVTWQQYIEYILHLLKLRSRGRFGGLKRRWQFPLARFLRFSLVGDLSTGQNQWQQRLKRFLKFNLICLAGLILNVLLLNFFFNVLHINRYIANLIAIAMVTVWNFWMNLKLSWRVTEVKPEKSGKP